MKVFVETDRLLLREILPGDEAAMFELDSDPEVHRYLGNKPVKELAAITDIIMHIREQYIENGIGRWAVVEKSTDTFVGWAGLKLNKVPMNNHVNYYDLGYRLTRKYWGRGIASECAPLVLQYGFETMKLPIIYAAAHIANAGSNKVLRKCGFNFIEEFVYEGINCNWYRMTKAAWSTAQNV